MTNTLYSAMQPYITLPARTAIEALSAQGVEPDLALTYLEAACGEALIYDEPVEPEEMREKGNAK